MTETLHIWTVDRLLVCLPATVGDALTSKLRELLGGSPGADEVLQLLAQDGLASVPPFVLAEVVPDGVRVLIRGELQAIAHGADGSSLTLGAGRATTWNDDVVTDIASISVALGPDGNRFEWLAGQPPAAADEAPAQPATEPEAADGPSDEPFEDDSGEPAAAAPATDPAGESHTLDEEAFLDLVEANAEPAEAAPAPAPSESPAPAVEAPASTDAGGAPDFSSLLQHTSSAPPSAPSVPAAPAGAPAAVPAPPPPPPGVGTGLGEHDGRTMTLADLRRIQQESPSGEVPAVEEPIRPSQVRAVKCPQGHPNPPVAAECRLCGQAIADRTVVPVPRPVIARLVFDSGLVVDVDRPQLLGRRPTAPTGAEDIPNLVTLPSPDSDLSRIHTSVRLEGWDVLVQDEGSTNGTEVQLPGRDPVRLREHDPVLVVEGTKVTMAGVVSFVVEPAVP